MSAAQDFDAPSPLDPKVVAEKLEMKERSCVSPHVLTPKHWDKMGMFIVTILISCE